MIDQTWVDAEIERGHYSLLRIVLAERHGSVTVDIIREELLQLVRAALASGAEPEAPKDLPPLRQYDFSDGVWVRLADHEAMRRAYQLEIDRLLAAAPARPPASPTPCPNGCHGLGPDCPICGRSGFVSPLDAPEAPQG